LTTIRKIVFVEERILAEAGHAAAQPTTRVAALAIIKNPFAGQDSRICPRCSRPAQSSAKDRAAFLTSRRLCWGIDLTNLETAIDLWHRLKGRPMARRAGYLILAAVVLEANGRDRLASLLHL
jgi:hypothetical protein